MFGTSWRCSRVRIGCRGLGTGSASARILDYRLGLLDDLFLAGEVVWGRFAGKRDSGSGQAGRHSLTRSTPISLAQRESLPWLLGGSAELGSDLSGAPQELVQVLSQRGASFLSELLSVTGRLSSDVEEILWQLAAAGRVTADSIEPLRLRIAGRAADRMNHRVPRRNDASSARVPPLYSNGYHSSMPSRRRPRAGYSPLVAVRLGKRRLRHRRIPGASVAPPLRHHLSRAYAPGAHGSAVAHPGPGPTAP